MFSAFLTEPHFLMTECPWRCIGKPLLECSDFAKRAFHSITVEFPQLIHKHICNCTECSRGP